MVSFTLQYFGDTAFLKRNETGFITVILARGKDGNTHPERLHFFSNKKESQHVEMQRNVKVPARFSCPLWFLAAFFTLLVQQPVRR